MASENYFVPGELIHYEPSFVHVLCSERQGSICDHCLSHSLNLRRCGTCKFVSYCGKKCQRDAWKEHKEECQYLHRLPEEMDDFLRLTGKVIFKLKGKDWKTCSYNIGNQTVSFADLISHSEERGKNPKTDLHFMEAMHLLEQYIGKENLPEEKDLVEIIGKVEHNKCDISNGGSIAVGLYFGISKIDHACIPTAVRVFRKRTVEIRALDKLPKSDLSKVTISYIPMIEVTDLATELFESFHRPCYCSDCSLPYGESVLSNIVDKKRAFGIIECTKQFLDQYGIRSKFQGYDRNNVEEMLKRQEGVLGDTNLLRIRLLTLKCITWSEISDIKKLIKFVERAFGPNSPELMGPLNNLRCTQMKAGNKSEMAQCRKKMEQLMKLHYGSSPDPEFAPNLDVDLLYHMLC